MLTRPSKKTCFKLSLVVSLMTVLIVNYSEVITFARKMMIENERKPPLSLIVYPSLTSELTSEQPWLPPKKWTMIIPTQLVDRITCRGSCYKLNGSFLEKGNNIPGIGTDVMVKMSHFLSLIKDGTRGILQTSDPVTSNYSITRLVNGKEDIFGLQYFGTDLTTDSYHFLHRPNHTDDATCQYRIGKNMTPLWTVGVRCKSASFDNGGVKSISIIDYRSPPVFVSGPKFAIQNFLDAFFYRDGMWALIVTLHPSGSKTAKWSLWAQRMLQEIRGEMVVTSLACPEERDVAEVSLEPLEGTKQAFDLVNGWQCQKEKSFYYCANDLAHEMRRHSLFDDNDILLLNKWLDGLTQSARYTEPQRLSKETTENDVLFGCVKHSPSLIKPRWEAPKPVKLFPNMFPKCPKISPETKRAMDPFADYTITKPSKVNDIALVVIFPFDNLYKNIPFLQDLHALYFSVIVYCGPSIEKFRKFQTQYSTPVSFIEVVPSRGYLAYECASRAMMMNYDVRGYLQISDDVVLNTWNLGQLPRDQFWWQPEVGFFERNSTFVPSFNKASKIIWWPWVKKNGSYGKVGIFKVWDGFKDIELTQAGTEKQKIVTSFKKMLWTNAGNKDAIFYHTADIFYVPAKFSHSWCMLWEPFHKYNVFLEMAVPTLIYGLDKVKNVFLMDGKYLWFSKRRDYAKFFKPTAHFLHPVKISNWEDSQRAKFTCETLLSLIVKERV